MLFVFKLYTFSHTVHHRNAAAKLRALGLPEAAIGAPSSQLRSRRKGGESPAPTPTRPARPDGGLRLSPSIMVVLMTPQRVSGLISFSDFPQWPKC